MSKRIALIIHNQIYHHPNLARLNPPSADTATLAALLRNPVVGNFHIVEILSNQAAAELRQRVADLFRRKQRHDELLLYFVGHGLIDEAGQLYLAAVDTQPNHLAETALSAAYLTECMDRSFSRRQILLLDCEFDYLASANGSVVYPAAAFRGKGSGRVVLAATDIVRADLAGDRRVGEESQTSLTPHLIEGIQSGAADADQDGQIELKELYDYIQRQAGPGANRLQPGLRGYGQQDRFIIARNPHLFVPAPAIKWDLISGAILAPLTILVVGGNADLRASIGIAGLFLLMYALLYLAPD